MRCRGFGAWSPRRGGRTPANEDRSIIPFERLLPVGQTKDETCEEEDGAVAVRMDDVSVER